MVKLQLITRSHQHRKSLMRKVFRKVENSSPNLGEKELKWQNLETSHD